MCKRSTLVQEKYGVISHCDNCKIIDLTFGNFSMQMSEEDFLMLLDFINNQYQRYANRASNFCRDIKINTRIDNLQLLVCYQELGQLQEMMSEAVLILEVEELLK